MVEITDLVYDDHSGTYISAEEIKGLSSYQNGQQLRGTEALFNQDYDREHINIIKNIIRLSPVVACIVLGNLVPLALYVAPLLSVALNPSKDIETTDGQSLPRPTKGRRRKGRTDLPLYDIHNDCMSTRANNI